MPWLIPLAAAAVGAGAAVYSSGQQSRAINSAAQAQQAADQAAIAEQRRQFDTNQSNLAPWLAAGRTALGSQMTLLGLGSPQGGSAPAPTVGGVNVAKLLADNPDIAAWVQAGHGDPNATGPQTPEQAVQYWVQNGIAQGDPRAINAPTYTQDDVAAAGAGPNTPQAQQQAAIDQLQASPLYQSLYRNGQNTITANASATGGLRGGNVQRSLANFGADTLSTVIENQLSHLAGISGQGQTTGGTLGALGAGTSTNISNLTVAQGGARAGGILGSAAVGNAGLNSALSQLLSGAGQSYAQYRTAQNSVGGNPPVVI